jgi:hypothetical protein
MIENLNKIDGLDALWNRALASTFHNEDNVKIDDYIISDSNKAKSFND